MEPIALAFLRKRAVRRTETLTRQLSSAGTTREWTLTGGGGGVWREAPDVRRQDGKLANARDWNSDRGAAEGEAAAPGMIQEDMQSTWLVCALMTWECNTPPEPSAAGRYFTARGGPHWPAQRCERLLMCCSNPVVLAAALGALSELWTCRPMLHGAERTRVAGAAL